MIKNLIRGLFMLAVFCICLLAGCVRLAHAAVLVEPLPSSANLPETITGVSASTMLTGNEILVTGGQTNSNGFAKHSYIFNPGTQTWASYAPVLQLAYHKQSMLNDGKVMVTGGNSFVSGTGYVYNNQARIYSPYSNAWTNGANLPKNILGNAQSTLGDGRVMIVGGSNEIYSAGSSELYSNTYIYDPSANRWDEMAPLPIGIYGAAQSTLKDGRVLLTGGLSGYVYSFNAYIYDPSNNTWTKVSSLPYTGGDIFFRHAQLTLANGKVLVMGNYNYYLYDSDTNTWTQDNVNEPNLVTANLVAVGNTAYVIGGYHYSDYSTNTTVYKLTFDFNAPTAPVINGAGAGWSASDTELTIIPGTDAESGVSRTEYSLSGATTLGWTVYNSGDTIAITNAGQTNISARTVDQSGNISTVAAASVKIDRTAPTAPVVNRSAASWTASDVNVTLTAGTDTGGSGVNRTEYSLSGATTLDWTAYTGQITVTSEGQTTVSARTIDNVGNLSTVSTAVVSIDKTTPAAPSVTPASASWSKTDVTVTIVAGTDTVSGVNRVEYKLSGATTANWTTYTGPVTISADGQTVVDARTVDHANNVSANGTATVKLDKTQPTAPAVTPSTTSWSAAANVQVTVTGGADSGSGVNRTEYSLSGATALGWTTYTGPVSVAAEGQTTVSARTVDQAGNISATSTGTVKIDRTAPSVAVINPASGGWTSSNVSVTMTAGADSGSGVSRVEYSLSGATTLGWTTYIGAVAIAAEGQTTVSARTVDQAGNNSTVSTSVVSIDKTAPGAPALSPSTSTPWTSAASLSVTATAGTDAGGSGVNRTEYQLSGATTLGWTTYTGPVVITAEGPTTVSARSVDFAGNVSATVTVGVNLDRSAPAVPTIQPSTTAWSSSNVSVTITAGTDTGGSGVNRAEYSLSGATMLGWTAVTGAVTVSAEGQTTVSARTVDNAGNVSTVAAANVRIDKTAPTLPGVTPSTVGWTSAASVSVTVAAGTDTSGSGVSRTEYSLSGAATAGWTTYTAPITVSAQGQTTVSARTVDQAGNTSAVKTTVVSIDRTAPTVPTVVPDTTAWTSAAGVPVTITAGTDAGGSGVSRTEYSLSGASTLDWTTYTGALTVTSEGRTTISARTVDQAGNVGPITTAAVQMDRTAPGTPVITSPAGDSWTRQPMPQIEGTAEAGAAVLLTLDGNVLAPVTANGSGQWTYTFSAVLADGPHALKAAVKDAAGNLSGETETVAFTIDTVPPAPPIISAPVNSAILASPAILVTGLAEAGSNVTVYMDQSAVASIAADAGGSWTYPYIGTPEDGIHTWKAEAADRAGNVSPASTIISWKLDTQAPPAPLIVSPVHSSLSVNNKPVISGTAEAGTSVTVRIDGTDATSVTADGGGLWSFTPADAFTDGPHTIEATAEDAAGNRSPASAKALIRIDTQAPEAPEWISPPDGAILNTSIPAMQGSAEAGASVQLIIDEVSAGSVTADSGGGWTFTPVSALGEGPHRVKAIAVDAGGNASPVSAVRTFTMDTVAPAAPAVVYPARGTVTNAARPSISGSSEASVTVSVYLDGIQAAEVTADSSGAWSYVPAILLGAGQHTVQAQAVDAAGNAGPLSIEQPFTIVSDNAGLHTLELSGMALNETVTSTTYEYTAHVPYEVTSTWITATPLDPKASVQLKKNGRPAANPVSLQVGTQTFTVEVTAQDGMTVQPYTVTVARGPSREVGLSELTIQPAALLPRFDAGVTTYTSTVTNDVYAITVKAKAASGEAALIINDTAFTGNEGTLRTDLKVGSNPITVTVTAQDGVSTQSYYIDVNRVPSSNVLLNGLQLSAGNLEPRFDSGRVRYQATVDHRTASTTVTASVYDRNATLTVNGQPAASGQASQPIALQTGLNPITVKVTAQDRVSVQSYTIDGFREPSPNVSLTGLELSGGLPTPAFASGITAYELRVGSGVDHTTVTASVYDPAVRLQVNGVTVASGEASEPIALQVGLNTIVLTVTSPDASTKLMYTVTVQRLSKSGSKGGPSGTPVVEVPPSPKPPVPEIPAIPEKPAEPSGYSPCTAASSPAARFADMAGHWAQQDVSAASGCGIVSGFEDGTFRPDAPVTRAQFVVMLMQAQGAQSEAGQASRQGQGAGSTHFADGNSIPAWASSAVSEAERNRIALGYEDGTFRPNAFVTRAEMITMAAKAFRLEPASPDAANAQFTDAADIPDWSKGYIAAARQKGFVQGREQGAFIPQAHSTRAEAVALLLRMVRSL
ncbi:OmpL47-type beta-barrel domain-containing protein [Paenibacillus rigui]|uniref:SLH domain-containing protein n=1 Tax=Paenibacillus rigui TaxID=554312 RepID=A0A229UG74_9BACL|nr:Ig-like domain-containing protein [Paenibacillus rigui]OXM82388.1 hypothetical protein CF651_31255 [Paenibacillus rigui]